MDIKKPNWAGRLDFIPRACGYCVLLLLFTTPGWAAVTGSVFRDFDADGVRDTYEPGVADITVSAYGDNNTLQTSTTTATDGSYTLTGTSGQVRVEFSGLPDYLYPGPFGSNAGTTVVFAADGASAVNAGLTNPAQYCQSSPTLATTCYTNGDPLLGGNAGGTDALVSFPYNASGTQSGSFPATHLAFSSQIGATWGLTYQRSSNSLFVAAMTKRHMGFGPGGIGAIYRVVGTTVSTFIDFNAVFGAGTVGTAPHSGLPANYTTPNADSDTFAAVGKTAFGGIALSEDEQTLWVMNLANRSLYELPVGLPPSAPPAGMVTVHAIPNPGCSNSDFRPWAVVVNDGKVYIGVVCSAQTSQNTSDLHAYVLSHDPNGATGSFSVEVDLPLNYPRGCITTAGGQCFDAEWRPWTDTFSSVYRNSTLAFGKHIIYPQPLLSDIAFDNDGSLLLGFMDRSGHQLGNANYRTATGTPVLYALDETSPPGGFSNTSIFEGVAGGDLLRACKTAGGYVLESGGSCGGRTSTATNNNQGPGNGEYYWQDMYQTSTTTTSGTHHEVIVGGLTMLPGRAEVALTVFDPLSNVRSGGLRWLNNVDPNADSTNDVGRVLRGYELFGQDANGTFGKAAGLGDVEALCDVAPLEIGNRVWRDSVPNGIQDPSENAVNGLTVTLYTNPDGVANNGDEVLAGTAVTDANGQYLFNAANVAGGVQPYTRYLLVIDPAAAVLNNLSPVPANAGADQRDSDYAPLPTGQGGALDGLLGVTLTTAGPAGNDHTFDAGFQVSFSLGNYVWLDDGAGGGTADDGIRNGGEAGIGNVLVELLDDTGTPVDFGSGAVTATTSASGFYLFGNLPTGSYSVRVAASNFQSGGVLAGYRSSTSTRPLAQDQEDKGIDNADPASNGLVSAVEVLSESDEPTGETDGGLGLGGALDNNANLTLDFGLVAVTYSLGNYVWLDNGVGGGVADDGMVNGSEAGISNVLVELLDGTGTPVLNGGSPVTATTNASGFYLFSGLPAGDYRVRIAASNFQSGGVLVGLRSSTGVQTAGIDQKDQGIDAADPATTGISSGTETLSLGTEPTGEDDGGLGTGGADDNNANLTLDFGLVAVTYSLGNYVWLDNGVGGGVADDGMVNGSEAGISNVLVELLDGTGTPVLNGGSPVTATTNASGFYLFSGLSAGDYRVRIAASNFQSGGALVGLRSSSGVRAATNDQQDKGIDVLNATSSGISSGTETLSLGTEPTGETDGGLGLGGALDNNSNLTLDFGFLNAPLSCALLCDYDQDNDVDANDIRLISTQRGRTVTPGTLGDCNNDGILSVNDASLCRTFCTRANCAP